MIRVERRRAPRGFNERVRRPGDAWLLRNPGAKKVPSYWRRVRRQLIAAFEGRCAYTAMWLSHDGDVDHFVSIDEDRRQAYRWDNLRYAAGWFNSTKQGVPSAQILDAFEVEDDWFEILLPSLELVVTPRCPPETRGRAQLMLTRLGLGRGEQVMRSRRAFHEQYRSGHVKLEHLDKVAPLLARALRKEQAARARPRT